MLYEIARAPSAANSVILLTPDDNVAIARIALAAGQEIAAGNLNLHTRDAIPAGHKVALRRIDPGGSIIRYGNIIGFATSPIQPGEHVHVHNLGYRDLDLSRVEPGSHALPRPSASQQRTFCGFRRPDGRAGTRNYIGVVAASNCAAYTADLIAADFRREALPPTVDGVLAFPHGEGCGMSIGPDTEQLQRTLEGVLDHPNISAALILGLGCEVNQISHYLGGAATTLRDDTGLHGLTLQEAGGTRAALEEARQHVHRFIERAAEERRTEVPASEIVLGLNCGGSDSFSGITANPALGVCCDLIVEQG